MKYLKMLGLAAVAAMALTAFLGASSASATVLCTTTTTPCDTHVDTIEASVMGSVTLRNTEKSIVDTCTGGTVKATKLKTGGVNETPVAAVTIANLTWSGCEFPTSTTEGGELEIHQIGTTENGTVTAKKFKVTINVGVSCTFTAGAGRSIGEVTGGTNVMHIEAVVEGSGFLCPTSGIWEGEYTITNHSKVYVEPS